MKIVHGQNEDQRHPSRIGIGYGRRGEHTTKLARSMGFMFWKGGRIVSVNAINIRKGSWKSTQVEEKKGSQDMGDTRGDDSGSYPLHSYFLEPLISTPIHNLHFKASHL